MPEVVGMGGAWEGKRGVEDGMMLAVLGCERGCCCKEIAAGASVKDLAS